MSFWFSCCYSGTAWAAENERVAAELKTIIDSGEPAIGNEDNDERIVEIYVFYASDRDYKPIWVRDNGPKSKAKEVLAVFKAAAEMGLNPDNYTVAEIERRMSASDPRGLAELELLLTRAFIDFGRDISRGRILPQRAGSENAIIAKELGALTLIDGAEAADSIAEYVADARTPDRRLSAAQESARHLSRDCRQGRMAEDSQGTGPQARDDRHADSRTAAISCRHRRPRCRTTRIGRDLRSPRWSRRSSASRRATG